MLWLLLASTLSVSPAANDPAPRRVALVVGANGAAPGRARLRYAHKDAEAIASALREVGEFADGDVEVLLDPEPEQLLRAMDAKLAQLQGSGSDGLFLFYYSGHSDERALYPRGKPLALLALRDRLDRAPPGLRIGIIDACRGGGWTQAKGLSPEAPFDVEVPLDTSSEGSVLISSSSGLESAHESEALEGSFFTHYFVAGMRGAATQSNPGNVSLVEAFNYAQQHTVRDTALKTGQPQHPSFHMNLQGRSDLVLARLDQSPSAIAVHERRGPLQLIQSNSGIALLDLPEGERELRLAVPPGDYILRRLERGQVFGSELEVKANTTLEVDEASLALTGTETLASKSEPLGRTTWTASLTQTVLAMPGGVGGGITANYYLYPLADDATATPDPDVLELLQRRGVISAIAGTLWLDGQALWEGGLSGRIYPWQSTGLIGHLVIAEGLGGSLEASFKLGVSQYLGHRFRLDFGYDGNHSVEGTPTVSGANVVFDQAQFDGAFADLQDAELHGKLRLDLHLRGGALEAVWPSVGTCNGEEGTADIAARWQFAHALAAHADVGLLVAQCSAEGARQLLLAPGGSLGLDYNFTDAFSIGATVVTGYSSVFNLELPSSVSGILSFTERF